MSCIRCNKPITKSHKFCQSCAKKGKNNPNFGKHPSKKTIKKMSDSQKRIGNKPPVYLLRGKEHCKWKGDDVKKGAIHYWLKSNFGKAYKCENLECKYPRKKTNGKIMSEPGRYEWANMNNHIYKRRREDFMMLCRSCHRKYDKRKYSPAEYIWH